MEGCPVKPWLSARAVSLGISFYYLKLKPQCWLGYRFEVHVVISWLFVYKLDLGIIGSTKALDVLWWLLFLRFLHTSQDICGAVSPHLLFWTLGVYLPLCLLWCHAIVLFSFNFPTFEFKISIRLFLRMTQSRSFTLFGSVVAFILPVVGSFYDSLLFGPVIV